MAEIKWTDGQLKAIEHRGSSMIVSAAAGSGKTAVLVERVIRLMDETDIDKMLVVTFTNAAAANMKQGIHKAILKRLENPKSDSEASHYTRQLSLLNNANITTLHSFCSRFVREHFDSLNLSPSIKLGDVTQLKLMLSESVEEAISEGYEKNDSDFVTFASQFVNKTNDSQISDMILDLYNFLMALPNPEDWLNKTVNMYESRDIKALQTETKIFNKLDYHIESLKKCAEHSLDIASKNPDFSYIVDKFMIDLEFAKKLYDNKENFDAIEDEFQNKPKSYAIARKSVDEKVSGELSKLHAPYKEHLKEISDILSTLNSMGLKEFFALQSTHVRAILKITLRAIEIYNARKREKDLLDFNDLEHLAISLLYENGEVSALAKELSLTLHSIIVDEYQDINPVQEAIITALSKDKTNLFMVGDIKQGIYGFRNTASSLFTDKVLKYSDHDGGECVYLSDNFRSRECVLSFANLLFKQLMSLEAGGASYTETEALHKKGDFPETEELTEVYVLHDELYAKSQVECEAIFCAKRIHELVESRFMVTDKSGELRPISYGDIAILSRSTKNTANEFCSVLSSLGIPVYSDALSNDFLSTMEIQSVLAFLKAFDNPLQDIYLLSAFTSPIFGTPDYDMIVRIRLSNKKVPLYVAMQNLPEEHQDHEVVSKFLNFISYWQNLSLRLSASELITRFLNETDFESYIEALDGGETRISNIRYLQTLSQSSYPGSELGSLYLFLTYLEKHSSGKTGLSSPKTLPENTNMVHLLTIHQSKGLEYPVVFLIQTGKKFNKSAHDSALRYHRDIGFGLDFRDATQNLLLKSPISNIINQVKTEEEMSEELRILYVALTRAKDKLIITGYTKEPDKLNEYATLAENCDDIPLSPKTIFSAKSFLHWILYALKRIDILPHSPIRIEFVGKVTAPEIKVNDEKSFSPKHPSEQLQERMNYEYPFSYETKLFSKVSVTELKRLTEETDENAHNIYKTPTTKVSFSTDKTSKDLGTLTHYVLENLDFTEDSIENTLIRMVLEKKLTEEEKAQINISSINWFLSSSLCEQIRKAKEIHKELSFNILTDASVLNSKLLDTKIQLQGTIDCLADLGDKLILIDFKTDNISADEVNKRSEQYKLQLEYYKKGAEKMFGKKDIEGYLVFLTPKETTKLF